MTVAGSGSPRPVMHDAGWHRAARSARCLAWVSLAWMLLEGAVGLWQGLMVGSIALTGWALGSAVEGLASVIVVWRFSGARTLSETAERRAQRRDVPELAAARPDGGESAAVDGNSLPILVSHGETGTSTTARRRPHNVIPSRSYPHEEVLLIESHEPARRCLSSGGH